MDRSCLWKGTGLLSPIVQLDGEVVEEDQFKYSFVSMYAEEDILYTLDEMFPRTEVIFTLESRVRVEPLSAYHFCILKVKVVAKSSSLSWPVCGFQRNQEDLKFIVIFIHSYLDVFHHNIFTTNVSQ